MEITKKLEKDWSPNREQFLDTSGRPLTQMLFLETVYSPSAIYTLKDVDHEYKGIIYPSIKRLYLEMEDPVEYEFANKYFLGWNHWQRICENKVITPHVYSWRYELELKLRSRAVSQFKKQAEKGGVQAIKWLAEKGWDVKIAGRPSKADIEKENKIMQNINNDFAEDFRRLVSVK